MADIKFRDTAHRDFFLENMMKCRVNCRPGKTGSKIQWTDSPPCGKLHRYPALYLRSVSAR